MHNYGGINGICLDKTRLHFDQFIINKDRCKSQTNNDVKWAALHKISYEKSDYLIREGPASHIFTQT